MSRRPRRLAVPLLLVAPFAVAPASAADERPQRDLDPAVIPSCEGDFDTPPELVRGKSPVWPASTLNIAWIEDREIRRLPLRWEVVASFTVDVQGRPRDVLSTATDPPSFARHTNAAIRDWRFRPATRAGVPVAASCRFRMTFDLT